MRKVFIIHNNQPVDGNFITAAFSTEDDAKKFIKNGQTIIGVELDKEIYTEICYIDGYSCPCGKCTGSTYYRTLPCPHCNGTLSPKKFGIRYKKGDIYE